MTTVKASTHMILQTLWFYLHVIMKTTKVKSEVQNAVNTKGMKQCFNDEQFHSGLLKLLKPFFFKPKCSS